MPSENEIAKAAERNSVNEIDSIIRDINQSLEVSMTELSDDEDILRNTIKIRVVHQLASRGRRRR